MIQRTNAVIKPVMDEIKTRLGFLANAINMETIPVRKTIIRASIITVVLF
jgi:hypothetical protein